MLRSLALEPQPTARQTREILVHIGHELAARGARVDYRVVGGLGFRMPAPWRSTLTHRFLAISAGVVTIGADSGDPWRVRYELRHTLIGWAAVVLMACVLAIGVHRWSGARLFNILVLVWAIAYVLPIAAADVVFRRWLDETCREAPRTMPPEPDQQPV